MNAHFPSRLNIVSFSRLAIVTLFLFSLSVSSSSAQETNPPIRNSFPKSWYEKSIADLPTIAPASMRQSLQSTGQWAFSEVFSFSLAEYWCENNVAVADFDHNGLQDIALLATTTHSTQPPYLYTSKVILLRNQGDWQFVSTTIVEYPEDHYGYAIQAGDLNSDGWADLVVRESSATHAMLNNQLGGFSESWTGGPGYDSVGLANVNSDTSLDILSGTQTGSGGKVEVFLNNSSGTNFSKSWESALYGADAGTINNVFSATLNSDSATDIVATEIYSGTLVTFTGNGTGTSFTQRDLLSLGNRAFGLAVGKVNTDTLTDSAVYVGWGQARVFLAQSNTISETWQSPNLEQAAFNLELADFDKDGFDDLFVGTFGDGALRAYINRPGIDFELMWSSNLAGSGYTGTAVDLDGNDYPDLIVGEQDSNGQSYIRILRNNIPFDKFVYLPLIQR